MINACFLGDILTFLRLQPFKPVNPVIVLVIRIEFFYALFFHNHCIAGIYIVDVLSSLHLHTSTLDYRQDYAS